MSMAQVESSWYFGDWSRLIPPTDLRYSFLRSDTFFTFFPPPPMFSSLPPTLGGAKFEEFILSALA